MKGLIENRLGISVARSSIRKVWQAAIVLHVLSDCQAALDFQNAAAFDREGVRLVLHRTWELLSRMDVPVNVTVASPSTRTAQPQGLKLFPTKHGSSSVLSPPLQDEVGQGHGAVDDVKDAEGVFPRR